MIYETSHPIPYIVERISAYYWMNRGFNDKSMKLLTVVYKVLKKLLNGRAIAILPCNYYGGHFPKWPPFVTESGL